MLKSVTVGVVSHCNASAFAATAACSPLMKISGNVDCGNSWPCAPAVSVRYASHRHGLMECHS
jgi:hypothetical protein